MGALVLAIAVSLGAVAANADTPPVVTIDSSPTAEYTTAQVSGTVNPSGGPSATYWHFEYTTTPDDEFSWQPGPGGEIAGPDAEGTSPVPVAGKIEFLQPETEYFVRLVAENGEFANRVATQSPYPTFTTKGPVAKPTVSIDPVTTFTDTTAHFSGTINPGAPSNDPGFNVQYEFHCVPACIPPNGLPLSGQIAADNSDHTVEVDASGLEPNTEYKVELTASNAGGAESAGPQSFTTTAVDPGAETVSAFALRGGTEALLGGRINPHNSPTTYWVEYGPTTAYGQSIPASEDASAGSGGTFQVFSQRVGGLTPSTVYHYRVVVENAVGQVVGVDKTVETAPAGPPVEPSCPNASLRQENNSAGLPDCRAYEQVSPIDKNGFDAGLNGGEYPTYVAAEDGPGIAYGSAGAFGDSQSAPLVSEYVARRGEAGWESHALIPLQHPSASGATAVVQWFSPDLRQAVMTGGSSGHLAPGDNPDINSLYLRDTLAGTYRTLNVEGIRDGYETSGGTADGKFVVFQTDDALPSVPDAVDGVNSSGGPISNVYEWNDGQLALASIRLNASDEEEPSPEGAHLPRNTESHRNEVSADGSRVIFIDNEDGQLYMREDGQKTYRVSESQRAVPDDRTPVTFQGASDDLSRIFFNTSSALTEDSIPGMASTYMYDVATETVTDLTAGRLPGGNLVDDIAGMSDSGEYVYFLTNYRFHPGDNAPGRIGLYVWHNGTIRFIASENRDSLDQKAGGYYTRYRVSPNGKLLSFESASQLTAYDNTDTVPAEDGSPREDREVYVYDAEADRLSCVSCNPSGERPAGEPNGGPAADSTLPEPPKFQFHNPQPGVGDDGHLFFNSRDALVPEDINAKTDVYEWKDGRVHLISKGTGGHSYLASSSVDGSDVYLVTRDRLVATDEDNNEDIYDARVGGGFPQARQANLCEGIEGCHGPAQAPASFDNPATGSFSSALKKPDPRAQRLRKALKACKHRKKKKARAKCRAAAKKRYGHASKRGTH